MRGSAEHLYLHVPFCGHRCGYCDFVTVTGHAELHARYVQALITELERERPAPRTIFIGGGTPSLLDDELLGRLLAALPSCDELTVECNPETITPAKARALVEGGVTRISLGAQSFQPHLLATLERRAAPVRVLDSVALLREAGVSNLNLDLMFGVPGQTREDLERDLEEALRVEPEHISYYDLEAKPGTRFTHAWGTELERQAEALEDYFERVVARLTSAGYRWYETANFCRTDASGRDLRARHNLAYWFGSDYLGLGIGAVSTIEGRRWRNTPSLGRYLEALAHGRTPDREIEWLDADVRARERVMLGLRLDEPLSLAGLRPALDPAGLARVERLGLAVEEDGALALTPRGRFLGGGVTVDILA